MTGRCSTASRRQSLFAVRVKFQPISTAPRAAVMYAGALLVMERGIWVGHTPLKHGRRVSAIDGAAESGDFLGSIVLGEWRDSSAKFSLLDPDWYRTNMDAFLSDAVSERLPFLLRLAAVDLSARMRLCAADE
jgi:hypothetical protein